MESYAFDVAPHEIDSYQWYLVRWTAVSSASRDGELSVVPREMDSYQWCLMGWRAVVPHEMESCL